MKRLLILLALSVVSPWLQATSNFEDDFLLFRNPGDAGIILESSIIKLVDGLAIGIDGKKIAMMFRVRKEVKRLQWGVAARKDEELVGIFEIGGNWYTIHQLAQLEDAFQETHSADLERAFEKAQKEFVTKVMPYMGTARGAKRQLLMLIEESCKKRKRMDSILLRWGAAKEEEEERQFYSDITDFKIFDIFCTDLMHFMEDVIRSCPKAMAQFKQMLEQAQKQQQH